MSDPTSNAVSADPGAPATPATGATPATPSASPMDLAVQKLMASKGMQSLQPPAPGSDQQAELPAEVAPAEVPAVEAAPEPTEPVISAPKNEREFLDRLARKDAQYQSARNETAQLKQQMAEFQRKQEEFFSRFSADPMAVMRERNIRFGDVAMQAAGKTPEGKAKDQPALPPEYVAEFEELKRFRTEYREQAQQQAQQQNRAHQEGLIKGVLEKDAQVPLVNELGKYGDVLDRVARHVGQNGAFADDREAEEVVAFYARQVESEARRDMLAHATKPGVKAWLAKELGFTAGAAPAQRAATPARPEIEGNQAQPNPRPALSNTITTQRTTAAQPEPWDKENARQKAVAEMTQVVQASRASH